MTANRSSLIVCTVVAAEQRAAATLLARDVLRLLPDAPLQALPVEGRVSVDGADNVFATELFGDATPRHEIEMCCTGADLAAALAPFLVAHLLAKSPDSTVLYLAPEYALFEVPSDIADLLARHPIVVMPRRLEAIPDDGLTPTAFEMDGAGAYDPGFVAVGAQGAAFVADWAAATLRLAAAGCSPALGLPFLDAAPARYGAVPIADMEHGLAYWNADRRTLSVKHSRLHANDAPLRSIHFRAFDPRNPHLLSADAGPRPRVRLSTSATLAKLCARRADSLLAVEEPTSLGGGELPDDPLAHVDVRARELYRQALALALDEGGTHPPDPLAPGGIDSLYEFLASPDPDNSAAPSLPRYLAALHRDRRDLSWTFPRVGTVDATRFRQWVENHGLEEERIAPGLRRALQATAWWSAPTGVQVVTDVAALRQGVALAGYLRAEGGLGEVARLTADVLREAGVEVSPVVVDRIESTQRRESAGVANVADREVNLIFVNADQLLGFASVVGPDYFDGRYNVGAWVYETEHLPPAMARHASVLDEIWVPSDYVRRAVEPAVDRPVYVVPYPVVAPMADESFDVATLGIDRPYFLFTYDFLSSFRRKNPIGALEAFRRAFDPGKGPLLVLKSVNGKRRPQELEELLLAAADREDVIVVDRSLTAGERGTLMSHCACFVSLHRSEGFGLGMAEAMALGRPVVASAYSGNLAFMNEEVAFLVPTQRVRVGSGAPPYPEDDTWGEPDADSAASLLREVFEAPELAAAVGERAAEHVARSFGPRVTRDAVCGRLEEIAAKRHRGFRSSAADAARALL